MENYYRPLSGDTWSEQSRESLPRDNTRRHTTIPKMLVRCLLLFLCGVSALADDNNTVTIESSESTEPASYRLPEDLIPDLYFLEIKTYLEDQFKYEGKVKVRFNCYNETSTIVLHSRGLNITEPQVRVNREDESPVEITGHEYDLENNFYKVKLDEPLKVGATYTIEIPYQAPLSTGLAGYYRSSYKDKETGKTKWMAVTQFEPTDARRAFPCFDEPAMKARFRISMIRPNLTRAISNMPITSSEALDDGWTRDVFAESVPMSTYLVAFVVSELASLESTPGKIKFRVWARPDAVAQASHSLDVGPRILDFFEKYFDVEYALPKMDMVAVPDFNSGAMENWGLVTYRETAMLYDEADSPASAKESVTRVVAHELAHQWFGNLVTMRWWDDLWLNEGFATYAAALGLAHVEPKWRSLDDQAMEAMLAVFTLDSLQSSHPVSAKIKHPSEITQIFDSISYSKGAFILRMMSHFLGQDTFRRGVTRYLKAHKFGNAAQDMLWAAFEEQAAIDHARSGKSVAPLKRGTVKQVMDSWTLQTGYPVVTVIRNYDDNTATLSQVRFLTDWLGRSGESSLWWVPLSYMYQGGVADTSPKAWLHENASSLSELPDKQKWLLLNVNATALYRINYDSHNWKLLSNALLNDQSRSEIPLMNRAQLIDDSLDLARAGLLEYSTALDVLRYLRHERNYLPWRSAFSNLAYFVRMTRRNAGYGPFRSFMRFLLGPVYSELGSEPFRARSLKDLLPDTKHRSQLLAWSCSLGVKDCEKRASVMFGTWQNQKEDHESVNPVSVDLRGAVYCTAVKVGDQGTWDFLWQRYLNSNVAAEKTKLLSALGCTREIWLLHKFLDMSLDENSGIRKQDAVSVFYSVARSSYGFYVAREFLMTRIKDVHTFLGPKASRLGRYFAAIAESMNTESDLKQMRQFAEDNADLLKDARLSIKQALENISLNVQWHSQYFNKVLDWLSQHSNATYFA